MAAPVAGAGCISINGELFVWTRWTRAGLDAAADLFDPVLGKPVAELSQLRAADDA